MKKPSQLIREVVWRGSGPLSWLGWLLLFPLSLLFGLGVALRGIGYRLGLLRSEKAPIPVVSVGNLAVGGTGKTPVTLWLASQLQARGLRVAIVLRGYGAKEKSAGVTVVSEGAGPLVSARVGGDEAVMIARRFKGPVLAATRRIEAVMTAAQMGCDLVVLDDGFQHRKLARDCDIVLVNRHKSGLLPAGPLRESWRALDRADAVLVVCKVESDEDATHSAVPAGKPVFLVRFHAQSLLEPDAGIWREVPVGQIAGRPLAVISGIADPEAFYDTIRRWDGHIEEVFEFPDHHEYDEVDWQQLLRKTRDIELILTTEKDLVKLERFPFARGKLLAMRVQPEVDRGDELVRLVLERTGLIDKMETQGGMDGD